MYFITEKTTETGKRFELMYENAKIALDTQKQIANELGFKQWRSEFGCFSGGFSSVFFDKKPKSKAWTKWKDSNNEYKLNLATKEGKGIRDRFKLLPKVTNEELNNCIGFKANFLEVIGNAVNDQYYGFEVGRNWKWERPNDCTEITETKYCELFNPLTTN